MLSALPFCGSLAYAQSRHVSLGHVGLSFYEVAASVIQIVLERLGYNVSVQKGSHAEIYPLLGKGEVELFVAAWLPNAHAPYWEQYKDSLEEAGYQLAPGKPADWMAAHPDTFNYWLQPDPEE